MGPHAPAGPGATMPRRLREAIALRAHLLIAALLLGCTNTSHGTRWDGTVRDSSGVAIVENGGHGLWPDSLAWRTGDALSIGRTEGDSAYLFGRVVDVAVDGQRDLLVLDQLAQRVRYFDASGRFLHAAGRPGKGPGELSAYANAVLLGKGDTLYVPDSVQRRINVYGPNGGFVRDIAIDARPGGQSWALLPDGRFLFRGLALSRDAQGQFQTWDGLLTTAVAGQIDTIAPFDYARSPLGGPGAPRVPLIVNAALWARLDDGRIAWSSLDRSEILVLDAQGRLQRIIRHRLWQRRPLTAGDRDALRELLRRKLTLIGGNANGIAKLDLIYDAQLPAFTALQGGPDHTLWVQLMGDVSTIDPMAVNATDRTGWLGGPQWQVMDGAGRFLGEVTVPPRVCVMRVTSDAVYGVQKDAQDVEHVVRLELRRGRR